MLKTQPRLAQLQQNRLDRSVVEKTKFSSNPTQQYLDVALGRGSADLEESRGKINRQGKYTVKGLPNVDKRQQQPKGLAPVSVSKPVGRTGPIINTERRVGGILKQEAGGGGAKPGNNAKTDNKKNTTFTFKEKAKVDSQKNQKLFQELDQMLAGKNSAPYPLFPKQKQIKQDSVALKPLPRREKVSLVTKESLYPKISQDIRDKPPTSYRGQPIPPLQKTGSIALESETWHAREMRARQRLQQLDRIDDFQHGNLSKRTKIFDDQRQTIGVPVHTSNTTGRRHIIADIPIYVPQYGTGNPSNQTVITNIQAVPADRAPQNTLPNVNPGAGVLKTGKFAHAPEGVYAGQYKGHAPGKNDHINSVFRDPVSERQQLEKSGRDQAQFEKENLKYFDTDPSSDTALFHSRNLPPQMNAKDSHRDKTLFSDPGPGRQGQVSMDSLEDLKYSPEGYLAEKRRLHRFEKENKIHQRYNSNNRQDQDGYRESSKFKDQNDRYRSFDRENSWIRDPHERPSEMGSFKKTETGYATGNAYKIASKIDPRLQSPRPNSRNQDWDTSRSFPAHTEYRDRERYSDRNTYRSLEEDTNRMSLDKEIRQTYADHLAKERDEKERPLYSDGNPDYRSRYKESSEYPRGSGYLQDTSGSYASVTAADKRRQYSERRVDPDTELDAYSKRVLDDSKTTERTDSAGRGKSKEKKVQYVLRNKSGLSKSQLTEPSSTLPENIPPSSTEMYRKDERNSVRTEPKSYGTAEEDRMSLHAIPRQDPIGSEKTKPPVQESREPVAAKSHPDHRIPAPHSMKDHNDLNRYFDEAEDQNNPANKIPFYSDNVSRYAKEKNEYRPGDMMTMTPVQEASAKHSELESRSNEENKTDQDKNTFDPYARSDRVDNRYVGRHESSLLDNTTPKLDELKKKFPSSDKTKYYFEDDRKSPWRNSDNTDRQGDPKPDELDFFSARGQPKDSKGESSVEYIKERIREKTLEKLKEKRENSSDRWESMFGKSKERTMDSQGPDVEDIHIDRGTARGSVKSSARGNNSETARGNDSGTGRGNDKSGPVDEDIDIDNLDDIETEMDEKELYVCYLMTDNGDAIGPLRLDIDDVQLGLPKPKPQQEQEQEKDDPDTEGMRNRQTGSHGLNEFSSRSHSMLMLTIDSEQQDPEDENLYITKRGKLTFVDLAGSEKVKDSNSTADTLVESNSINKSLLVLGNCISSLGDQKRRQGHIPYRDSKLTKLLADSLGGNGVTLMICCITPSSHHASETLNTLRYASRAKKIRTKPVIKMDPREKLILSLKKEIKVLRNENHYLRQQLDFPAKPKGNLQKENDKNFVKMVKEANGKPPNNTSTDTSTAHPPERLKQNGASDESGLYEMLQEYMVENEALRSENAEMQVVRDKIRQDQQLLYRDNERLMKRIDELERKVAHAGVAWQSMPRQGSHPQDHGQHPQHHRSRDHSPRGSPQYARGAAPNQQQRLPPPTDLPVRDNPALRDPIYPGSPPQGYSSPTGSGHKGKQPSRGQPMKPPHRLADSLPQQRPVNEINGAYMNGHPPPNIPPQMRPAHNVSSPNRVQDIRMDSRRSSQSSSSDAIRDMNEKLKQELMQLEGEIHHHTVMHNTRTHGGAGGSGGMYGSQGSMR